MPFSSRCGGTRNRAREDEGRGGRKRERESARTSEEQHSDFQRVDKEAPSMQIKCCFHNHSSVPLSEVRFFVIKVKGTFTRGRVRSFAPTNQPANQPASPITQPANHPPTHLPGYHPSTNYPSDFNNRKLRHALCDANKKISFVPPVNLDVCSFFFILSSLSFCEKNKHFEFSADLIQLRNCTT